MTTKKKAKKRSFKKNPMMIVTSSRKARNSSRRPKRRNPFLKRSRKRSFKRNPNFAGFSMSSASKIIAGGLAGGLAARALPSVILKDKNVGPVGILANLATTGILTFLASKWDGQVAAGVLAGGGACTLQRVWDTYVSKVISDGTGHAPAMGKGKTATTPAAAAQNQMAPDGTPKLGDVSFSGDGMGFYNSSTWPNVQIGPAIDNSNSMPAPAGLTATFKPPFAIAS